MHLHAALSLTLDSSAPDVIAFVGGGGKSSAVFRLATDAAAAGHRTLITHTARIAAFQTAWAPAYIEYAGGPLPLDKLGRLLATHGCCLLTGPLVGDRRLGLRPEIVDELARRAPELGVACITVEADGSKMRPLKAPAEHEPVVPDSTTLLAPMLGLDAIGASIDAQHVHRPELVRRALGLDDASSFSSTAGVLDRGGGRSPDAGAGGAADGASRRRRQGPAGDRSLHTASEQGRRNHTPGRRTPGGALAGRAWATSAAHGRWAGR